MTRISVTERGLLVDNVFQAPWSHVTCFELVESRPNSARVVYYANPGPSSPFCLLRRKKKAALHRNEMEGDIQGDMQSIIENVDEWRGSIVTKGMKLLAVVNPNAGKGRGNSQKALEVARTVLQDAGVIVDVVFTTPSGGGKKAIMDGFDGKRKEYAGVLCVGGDGTVGEVTNGLLQLGIDEGDDISVGIIPAGSGNALAWSLGIGGAKEAALAILYSLRLGRGTPLKVMKYSRDDNSNDVFSVCGVLYGVTADADLATESFRWLGDLRFDLYGFGALLIKKVYRAKIEMKLNLEVQRSMEARRGFTAVIDPDRGDIMTGDKVTLYGDFVSVAAWSVSHLNESTKMHPFARWSEDCIDVVIVRASASRSRLLKGFLAMSDDTPWMKKGFEEFCDYYKVKSIKIRPENGKYMSLDGEFQSVAPTSLSLTHETGRIKILAQDQTCD